MDAHELAEERSLAYHATVAERLRAEPARVEQARARVLEWLEAGWPHVHYARAWNEILAKSLDEICAALVDRSERARALRQTTPFAGFLPPRERWAIWQSVRQKMAG